MEWILPISETKRIINMMNVSTCDTKMLFNLWWSQREGINHQLRSARSELIQNRQEMSHVTVIFKKK
jgi:hypothetical protein